jgi:hypothetical protein
MTPCKVAGCSRHAHANGLCHAHNMRRWKGWDTHGPIRRKGRLPPGAAQKIRRVYVSNSAPTMAELASEYTVSRVTIWRVLHAVRAHFNDGLQVRIDARAWENDHPQSR